MDKKTGRCTGFTLTEILVIIAILMPIITIALVVGAGFNARQIGKEVATQTKQYASLFAPYVYDMSESDLYQMRSGSGDVCDRIDPFTATGSNTYVFSLADLQANNFGTKYTQKKDAYGIQTYYCHPKPNYWNDIYSQTNRYKQIPCLGVTKDSLGKYHGLLYWVNNASSKRLPGQMARHAAIDLGDAGAYVKNGKVVGANWSVPLSDPRLDGTNCGGVLAESSIVYNLDMTTWVDELMPSGYIARESDNVHDAGTVANTNTAQTSIIMNGNSIVLDKTNNITMKATANGLQLTGGTVQAEAISPQQAVDSGSECAANELSTLKKQKDDDLVQLGGSIANEICTYSPVICRLYVNSDYCYLPTKKATINYHPNTTSFTCPRPVPYMKSATAVYPDGSSAAIQELGYNMSGYNIVRGANAITSSVCKQWQYNAVVFDRYVWNGMLTFCQNKTSTRTCNTGETIQLEKCLRNGLPKYSVNCDGSDSNVSNWKCISNTGTAVLSSVICTNKYFIDQQ